MTLSQSEAKFLDYSKFFEGLKTLHSDPKLRQEISKLQEKTSAVLKGSSTQQKTWEAKLRYMADRKAGWNAESPLVSGSSILSAKKIFTELDQFMDTTHVELSSSPSGCLSLYWFDGDKKYSIDIVSDNEYTVSRSASIGVKGKSHFFLSRTATVKKILKWTTA